MKTILIATITVITLTSNVFSQITPGSYVVGGGLSFRLKQYRPTDYQSQQNLNFTISPDIGKFVSEKWLVRGGLGYELHSNRSEFGGINPSSSHTLSNSYSVRFGMTRFIPMGKQFYFTLGGFISPQYTTVKTVQSSITSYNSSYNIVSGEINLTPGVTYFINNKWMLFSQFGALNYTVDKRSDLNNVTNNLSFNLNANTYLIGMRYVFGSKKTE